jgi:hypothetical protein
MKPKSTLLVTVLCILALSMACEMPIFSAEGLEDYAQFNQRHWNAEEQRLADMNCDINSEEASDYRQCIQDQCIGASSTAGREDEDMGVWQWTCREHLERIPGCDSSPLPSQDLQLSLATLQDHVPLTYQCPRPDSFGSWFVHLDTDLAYNDNYNFKIMVTSDTAFQVDFEVSYQRQFDADPISYSYQERTGTGSGTVANDGFLEGTATANNYLKDWWLHDTRGEETTREINSSENYWVIGILHPDLLMLEVCSAIQGAYTYNGDAAREGGWQALASSGCPSLAFPGHLTCTHVP